MLTYSPSLTQSEHKNRKRLSLCLMFIENELNHNDCLPIRLFQLLIVLSGEYTCVATNVAGVAQRDMTLEVLVPPKIRKGPSLIKVSEWV